MPYRKAEGVEPVVEINSGSDLASLLSKVALMEELIHITLELVRLYGLIANRNP